MTEGLRRGPGAGLREPAHRRAGDRRHPARPPGRCRRAPAGLATMAAVERGEAARATPQAEEGVTYAKKIRPKEARIRLDQAGRRRSTARSAACRPSRAPGSNCRRRRGRCGSRRCCPGVEDAEGAPGRTLDDALLIALRRGRGAPAARPARGQGPQDADDLPARLARPGRDASSADAPLPPPDRVRRPALSRLPGPGRPALGAGLDRARGERPSRGEAMPHAARPAAPTPASTPPARWSMSTWPRTGGRGRCATR